MRTHTISRRAAGFTLLEILVAVTIFAIVGVMAMGGYNQLVRQGEIVESSASRTREVQAAMQRLANDFASLEPRPVRETLGDNVEPALRADARTQQLASLTRSSWTNPAGVQRPTLQRVAYRLEDTKLVRDYWTVLDRTLATEPVSTTLLDRVKSVRLRFMDGSRAWHDEWPPLGGSAGPDMARQRPIAVEITVELEDWGQIMRLVEVSG